MVLLAIAIYMVVNIARTLFALCQKHQKEKEKKTHDPLSSLYPWLFIITLISLILTCTAIHQI